jgi:coenzyme F420-reducing hydrogenase gamma subunit
MESVDHNNPAEKQKMKIGWFSFTCCEDSTILFTELLNDNYDTWRKLVDFQHVKALKTDNTLEGLDVAFVEGAISADSQAEELQKIRANAKYVVAIGSCACTGLPSASRNAFTEINIDERIQWYFDTFDYGEKVRKLDEVIAVDDYVKGCPMNTGVFLEILMKYLGIFGLVETSVEG